MLYARNGAAGTLASTVRATAAVRAIPYRPDIDGLRALSVLAVILFHAKVPGFAGGYVGVDVFFVISGYLITQLLATRSDQTATRRLRDFYVRRCRRILPALIVMLSATAPFASWLFLPSDLTSYGRQLSATAVFLGNLVTLGTAGYFDVQTPVDPLAHLWSIAVEEQFYLTFPLLFLASGLWRARRAALFGVAALASFALCVWGSYAHPNANFYLAPTRAWELLLGALVALGVGRPLRDHPLGDGLAACALAALAACVFSFDRSTPYPGLNALVPCGSTAILLVTGGGSASRVSRWLAVRPLVFTGLISYSLYLWHVPVLDFAKHFRIRPLEAEETATLLCSVYLLAALTWRYIEVPFRSRALLGSDARFLPAAAGATLAIAALGAILWLSDGLPGRLNEAEATLVDVADPLLENASSCIRSSEEIAAGSLCSFGTGTGARADVLIWGDSHAIALFPAYEQIAAARDARLYAAVHAACRPLLDASSRRDRAIRRRQCGEFNRAVVEAIDKLDPAIVILNAYWMFPDLEIELDGGDTPGDEPAFELSLERTLAAIGSGSRRKVCVVGDVPKLDYDLPPAYLVVRRNRGMDPGLLALDRSDVELRLRELDGYFAAVRERHRFTLVDPTATLCAGSKCPLLTSDGRSVYRDDNHLAVPGAQLLTRPLEACFDDSG